MAKKFRLSKKREKWLGARTIALKGLALRQPITEQNRYTRKIERLTKAMIADFEKEFRRLLRGEAAKEYFGQDASIGSQARILLNQLSKKYDSMFTGAAAELSKGMVTGINQASQIDMFHSLKKLSGGLTISTKHISADMKEIMKAKVAENIDQIKSIPSEYMKSVTGSVMRSISHPEEGGLSGLQKHLAGVFAETGVKTFNKARNTALDQTRKAYNDLNAARMKSVGLNKFEWVHSGGGQRPREHHRDVLNGNIYSLDDLPIIQKSPEIRGIPGQLINCRCTMLPVIEFEDGDKVED